MTFLRKRIAAVAAVSVVAALAVGCSGSAGESGEGQALDPENPTPVTVGTLPAGDYAPLYIAQDQGFFEEEGLDVEIEIIAGGAVGVTQLVSGEIDFSAATWANTLSAVAQGLEIQVVREGTDSQKEGINGLIVQADGPIQSVEDLRGETISINTLQSATEVQIRDCLASEGLEPGDYELVEVAFPDAAAAVDQGRIAAGFVPEPFITIGESQGLEPLFYPSTCNELQSELPLINWNVSTSYAEEHPEVVAAFVRAMDRATELAVDDPQVVIDILPEFTTLTPELAESITQPSFVVDGAPNLAGAEKMMDLMVDYGLLEAPIDDLEPIAWKE
ncbi:ABC transporter substrate-binding protein [Leucobacter allii]|uniref:ABC transporter substrate-binding protein n=1 Tax=Leucobacter allii TaxID=2932247 RepID=A0ABY4FM71_9MICO|nr:ABC transporter substrate-binding protein [Leucobacter allii]UOQ57373.1 ABC transporter substrate-binding protein [Leucobacter allii]UOR01821.1 ABC transporter substrate-binding protein [Leucobacter allii]